MGNPNPKNAFQKGNPGKPKGAISGKTSAKLALIDTWKDISSFIENEGAAIFLDKMRKLKPRDYVATYLAMLEYHKPKLSRVEMHTDGNQQIINIFGTAIESEH